LYDFALPRAERENSFALVAGHEMVFARKEVRPEVGEQRINIGRSFGVANH